MVPDQWHNVMLCTAIWQGNSGSNSGSGEAGSSLCSVSRTLVFVCGYSYERPWPTRPSWIMNSQQCCHVTSFLEVSLWTRLIIGHWELSLLSVEWKEEGDPGTGSWLGRGGGVSSLFLSPCSSSTYLCHFKPPGNRTYVYCRLKTYHNNGLHDSWLNVIYGGLCANKLYLSPREKILQKVLEIVGWISTTFLYEYMHMLTLHPVSHLSCCKSSTFPHLSILLPQWRASKKVLSSI